MRQNHLPTLPQDAAVTRAEAPREPATARPRHETMLEAACAIDQQALWSTRRIRGFIVSQQPQGLRRR